MTYICALIIVSLIISKIAESHDLSVSGSGGGNSLDKLQGSIQTDVKYDINENNNVQLSVSRDGMLTGRQNVDSVTAGYQHKFNSGSDLTGSFARNSHRF